MSALVRLWSVPHERAAACASDWLVMEKGSINRVGMIQLGIGIGHPSKEKSKKGQRENEFLHTCRLFSIG